jgi:parallel beta-helix repeat protein
MNYFKQFVTGMLGALAFCAVLGSSGSAGATSGVIRTGYMIMEEDHYGTIIMAGDGYLDCNGFTIYNSDQDAVCYDEEEVFQCGVLVEGALEQGSIDIKRCNIEGFTQGISASFSWDNIWIYDSTIIDNGQGVRATYSHNLTLFGNDISSNTDVGLRIYESTLSFKTSDVYYNGVDGVDGDGAWGVLIQGNILKENGDHGMEFDNSDYVTVKSNNIDGYRSGGVNIDTNRDGIQIETTNHFTVEGNTVRDSGRHGIYLRDSLNGVVKTNNVATSGRIESGFDCRRNGGSMTTFSSNTFGTHSLCTTVN